MVAGRVRAWWEREGRGNGGKKARARGREACMFLCKEKACRHGEKKAAPSGMLLCYAICNHAMRTGKHTCQAYIHMSGHSITHLSVLHAKMKVHV